MDMDMDPEDIIRDDDDDDDGSEKEVYQDGSFSKELVVCLVDASQKMFSNVCLPDLFRGDRLIENVTSFHIAVSCISQYLRIQVINRSHDEVAICFFNTKEKKNLQDSDSVFVYNVPGREHLDRPTASLIKEFGQIEESFLNEIGSKHGIVSGSRENSLHNALWAAQELLRTRSSKKADKRILLFTNEDNPFGSIEGAAKTDLTRTTLQRAKDIQEFGISIELLLVSKPDEFDVSLFYAELMRLEGKDHFQFIPSAIQTLEDMKEQLRMRIHRKRAVRNIMFSIGDNFKIQLKAYALIRPAVPGAVTWLDFVTNLPLKAERSFICADTGAVMKHPTERFCSYKNEDIKFSSNELSEIKRVSTGQLCLLGFKPLSCLKDYHNLRPSIFLFPTDKEIIGSTCFFIALHRSMLRRKRFAVAFDGILSRMVALVAQDELIEDGFQVEPAGMQMIYLPYSEDIRRAEERHSAAAVAPRASDDQIKKAASLIKRMELKDFSASQFPNPALQRHYEVLEALALEEDVKSEIKDYTVPNEKDLTRPGVVKATEEFKLSVYGENYNDNDNIADKGQPSEASRKRKAAEEKAVMECANHDWEHLAETGSLEDLTVVDLKYYLTAHKLLVSGSKATLVSRILAHLGR